MTDISAWHELVHVAQLIYRDAWTGKSDKKVFSQYIMIPLNEYQMGNLLDALTQSHDNGDWYHELQDIFGVAMEKAGITELRSNSGKIFTYDQVRKRLINEKVK